MDLIKNLIRLLALLTLLLGASLAPANASQPAFMPDKLSEDFRTSLLRQTPSHNDFISNQDPAAANSISLEMIGHLGGLAYAVALEGDYAYLATQGELAVLDVSDPVHPVRVGYASIPSLRGYIHRMIASKGCVYIDYYFWGMAIIDVSNPFEPLYLGTIGYSQGMAIYEDYAFLPLNDMVWIYDLSQPGLPWPVASYIASSERHYTNIVISSHYAYLLAYGSLEILDLLTPTVPRLVGSLENLSGGSLAVQGNYVYVSSGPVSGPGYSSTDLQIVDISNPALPVLVGAITIDSYYIFHMVALGQNLYAAAAPFSGYSEGLLIFSLSESPYPALKGRIATKGNAYDVVVAPDLKHAFVADGEGGLQVFDVSDILHPFEIGAYDPPSTIQSMVVADGFTYTSSGAYGIHAVDLSNLQDPKVTGFLPAWGEAYDLHVDGVYAYVAEMNGGGIRVYNIADPAHMTEVASVSGSFNRLILGGGYLYTWQDTDGYLTVFDVDVPTHPIQVGTYHTSTIHDVALTGRIAYIATESDGCLIVDFSIPGSPIASGQCTQRSVHDVEISGDYAYLMTADGDLLVFDISIPTAPVQVGEYSLTSNYSLRVYGNLAFLSGKVIRNLILLDISDPLSPPQVLYTDPVAYNDVVRVGDIVYLGGDGGLSIMSLLSPLSGEVIDASSYPAAGVLVRASSGISVSTGMDGSYLLDNLPIGGYTITPTLSGYTFIPPNRSLTLPAGAANQNFTLLPEPASITATPGITATLVYTGYQRYPTSFEIPPGIFSQAAQVVVTPTVGAGLPGWAFTGHAFDLAAQNSQGPVMEFSAPVPVTIAYSDFDIRSVIDESKLALYRWNGSAWTEASAFCSPTATYTRDPAANRLTLPICQTGKYALYGPTHAILLPAVLLNIR
jgi:hypothetical protein